jgi:hypothetical protein
VAVAVKVTGDPAKPAALALRVFAPGLSPRVQLPTVAIPSLPVVCDAPVRPPAPEVTAKVTGTSGTGFS